ncbi:MAG: pyruvate dehydrogenase complex dihydrolipoamide acetyltransferase [Bacteroidales bacterium]
MASRVVMPKLSDTMEEGRILRWLKQEGDPVETGQALAEVETDKATVEMEAYTNGTLRKLFAAQGDTVEVGRLIAVIGGSDEDISSIVAEAEGQRSPQAAKAPAAAAAEPSPVAAPTPSRPAAAPRAARVPRTPTPATPRPAPAPQPPTTRAAPPATDRRSYRASPLAVRMAAEAGVDLGAIEGSGPQGRIIKRDIEAAMAGSPQPRAEAAETTRVSAVGVGREGPEYEDFELSQMRRTIAKRLVQSKAPVPHFYLTVDLAMDRAWRGYRALREEESPVTINDIVIKAVALALRRHPEINASFAGDHVRRYNRVHVGVAVALDEGLITPVVRDADLKSLEEISAEVKALVERARARKLQPHEYTGSTFSVSNLGMMGIEEFSAVINPPEAGILAVGAVREVPVVEKGALAVGRRMKATLSIDHRVADGAMGARFLQTLRRLLENPLLMA